MITSRAARGASRMRPETIRLWPAEPPALQRGVPPESTYVVPQGVLAGAALVRNISDPTLTVLMPAPDKANGRGVIVVPGGGWTINALTHEGLDVGAWLNTAGYAAFVLKYRVQATDPDDRTFGPRMTEALTAMSTTMRSADKPRSTSGLPTTPAHQHARLMAAEDGRRAIKIVRENADRFGVRSDALGMIGFSAGAFVAVDIAMDPRGEQLAWIAPLYGGEVGEAPVPADAPALFAAVAQDDALSRIAQELHTTWVQADRPAELHFFSRGGHGFGMVRQGLPSDRWPELLSMWVDALGRA